MGVLKLDDSVFGSADGGHHLDDLAIPPAALPETATVLEEPDEDAGAFAQLVGRYAAALATGTAAQAAWKSAVDKSGWEPAAAAEQATQ